MDLNAPLGMNPPPPRQRPWALVVVLTLVVLACTGVGAFLFTADPNGGEPFATAAIPPAPPPKPVAAAQPPAIATDPTPTGSLAETAAAPQPEASAKAENSVRIENGVRVVSPLGSARNEPDRGPLVIDVSKALDGAARKPAARPPELQANAQPQMPPQTPAARTAPTRATSTTSVSNGGGAQPRVAIFVGGLGLSDTATRTAIEILPAAVSLAFVPYGDKIAASVGDAKGRGHEILLQMPMQGPRGAPPGPHALRADEPPAEMKADLDWLTSRFEGYAGATNLLGADVTADRATMGAILGRLGQRNLFYVDDGTSKRSVAPDIGGQMGVGTVRADVVLDATGDPAMVRANLERLVAIAKAKGTAIGVASSLSDHLALVSRFAGDLAGRGIILVPVGTLVRGGAGIASAR